MGYIVDNAVIMAAGTSSRFAPLSYEMPKALITVKGEVLIERQICQLQEAGIKEIIIVVGYKKEQFYYLKKKYGVTIVENDEYLTRNNNGSIYAVRKYLKNTYICSADNYFAENPFESEVDESYYAAVYAKGPTQEWCMEEDENGKIIGVQIGGSNAWYMLGHTFWSKEFSQKFLGILEKEYELPETRGLLWESIYKNHLDELEMKIRKYNNNIIFEFDTLDELRTFDDSYVYNTRSAIMCALATKHGGKECDITNIKAIKGSNNDAIGFQYIYNNLEYEYFY